MYSRCHCISKSLNVPQRALPFHHAASSTSRLCNHCFPSDKSHSQSVSPHWAEAAPWGSRYGRVGAGGLGVAGDMFSCTEYPHSENLWCPAVSDADCIAQTCCKPGGIRVEIPRWANEASDSTSLRESNPEGCGALSFSLDMKRLISNVSFPAPSSPGLREVGECALHGEREGSY